MKMYKTQLSILLTHISTYFSPFLLTNRKQTACTTDRTLFCLYANTKWNEPLPVLEFHLTFCAQAIGGKKHWNMLISSVQRCVTLQGMYVCLYEPQWEMIRPHKEFFFRRASIPRLSSGEDYLPNHISF